MEKENINYWQHRISHEASVSYDLLDKYCYLSIGWKYIKDEDINKLINAAKTKDKVSFRNVMESIDDSRSKWSLYNFLCMKENDIVVVPRHNGEFSIVRVKGVPEPYSRFSKKILINKEVDLGFFIKVEFAFSDKEIKVKKRKIADACLASRMKVRTATNSVDDLKENIQEAIKNNEPINFHDQLIEDISPKFMETMQKYIKPDDLERLISVYFKKFGAKTEVLPKNERFKEDDADADVEVIFENLKLIIYVQAKNYKKESDAGEWAVKQIKGYVKQKKKKKFEKDEMNKDYKMLSWVITTAKDFSEEAKREAEGVDGKDVRLISGGEFVEMLLDAGLMNVNDCFGC